MILHWLFGLFSLFSNGETPIDSVRADVANSAAECKLCHEEEYEEWRSSRHSMAWTNDFFQFDYAKEKRAWCRNCHIPLAAQQEDSDAARLLRDEGVNCIACHVRGDTFYALRKRASSPHNTKATPEFGSDVFCASCHQFNFPVFDESSNYLSYTQQPMQKTVEEFRSGPFASSHTCRDCHANTPGKHAYRGGHSLAMLQQALAFEVCRAGGALHTKLTNQGAGHNVPTGDVHRNMVVKAWRSTAPEKLQEAFYGRRFKPLLSGGKRTIWDSSIPPNTYRRWKLNPERLGGSVDEAVNFEVRYLYGSREVYPQGFAEPAYQTVFRVRKAVSELPACPTKD